MKGTRQGCFRRESDVRVGGERPLNRWSADFGSAESECWVLYIHFILIKMCRTLLRCYVSGRSFHSIAGTVWCFVLWCGASAGDYRIGITQIRPASSHRLPNQHDLIAPRSVCAVPSIHRYSLSQLWITGLHSPLALIYWHQEDYKRGICIRSWNTSTQPRSSTSTFLAFVSSHIASARVSIYWLPAFSFPFWNSTAIF